MPRLVLIVGTLLVAVVGFGLTPVCVPISAQEAAAFQPPIEERTDKDFYLRVFQRRNGQWVQCKTRVSRAFFF
jgi:hypothetical protein